MRMRAEADIVDGRTDGGRRADEHNLKVVLDQDLI